MKIVVELSIELCITQSMCERLRAVLQDGSIESLLKEKLESESGLLGNGFPPDDDYCERLSVVELLLLDSICHIENNPE